MNLHAMAAPYIGTVNPFIPAQWQVSTGDTENADGTVTPSYAAAVSVQIQVQALTGPEIERLNGLGIQGVLRKVYMNGQPEGIDRLLLKGGDLLTFNGATWLVRAVDETWPDWSGVPVSLQLS